MKLWRTQPKEQRIYAWIQGIETVRVQIPSNHTVESFFKLITSNVIGDNSWLIGDSIWRRGPENLHFQRSQAVFWLGD